MTVHIYSTGKEIKSIRSIDLDFIQDLIKKMETSHNGKLQTLMVSDDYCQRGLVAGLGPFVVIESPTASYLVLTDVSSYYHAKMYFESLDHFKVISILHDKSTEIAALMERVKGHPKVLLPFLRDYYYTGNPFPGIPHDYEGIAQDPAATRINIDNKLVTLYLHRAHYIACKAEDEKKGVLTIDLEKEYEIPITSISEDMPGIKL